MNQSRLFPVDEPVVTGGGVYRSKSAEDADGPVTAEQYISRIESAVRGSSYFINDAELRRERNVAMLHDIGAGLATYPEGEIKGVLNTIYSRVVIVNSLDSVGVVLSQHEVIQALKEGMAKHAGWSGG